MIINLVQLVIRLDKRRYYVEQLTAVGLLPDLRLLYLDLAEKPPLRLEPVDVGEDQREAVEVDVWDDLEAKDFLHADDVALKPKAKKYNYLQLIF